jgi:hypothetical protein
LLVEAVVGASDRNPLGPRVKLWNPGITEFTFRRESSYLNVVVACSKTFFI